MSAVFITGHSRSGTSLTAGLLSSQGVWFGPCHGPAWTNQKGFYESTMLKDKIKSRQLSNFWQQWDDWRAANGAGSCWGVKTGPEYYHLFERYQPIVVCTVRDPKAIIDSRKRAGFKNHNGAMSKAELWISKLPSNTIKVYPDEFIKGNFDSLFTVLSRLGLNFNTEAAESWIDPGLWSGIVKNK